MPYGATEGRRPHTQAKEHLFWNKVEKLPGGCWLWMGNRTIHGYGRLRRGSSYFYAHRFAYLLLVGPIPEGMTLDHLCRVRNCVNPEHLEVVTPEENIRRGLEVRGGLTHCKRGHEFSPENTHVRPCGRRRCRACVRELRRAARTSP